MKIISFGEIIWDIYPDASHIGGAPLNFAAHAAKLGAGVQLISAVGDDDLGAAAREALSRFGVDDSLVSTVPDRPTGQCLVTLDAQDKPHYTLWEDTAYDAITCGAAPHCDAFVFGTLIQRSHHNRRTLQQLLESGCLGEVFCDLNIRPPHYDVESVERCLRHATMLKVSREELPAVTQLLYGQSLNVEAAVARLCADHPNIRLCLVTLDRDGAFVRDTRTGRTYRCAAKPVDVVSTVGAGDSFGAAFLVTYLRTGDIAASLQTAVEVSAHVVAHKEAVPPDEEV
ncbi:MAG: carbohydrate kinase [Ruminococcaceae bacterium]|nr:carbohydrate kinase [Oscillospiraceae bacterium]